MITTTIRTAAGLRISDRTGPGKEGE